jgi:hypothetical protein
MYHLEIILSVNPSKLLLNIMHGLFILLAFLDILKEGMPLELLFLVNLAAELFVL